MTAEDRTVREGTGQDIAADGAARRSALVTGAGKGIGRAIAVKLAACGMDVIVHCGKSREQAEETAEMCRAHGVRACVAAADLTKTEEIDRLFQEAKAFSGGPDVLVNNAGITRDGLIVRMSPEDFDAVIRSNLFSAFYCMKKAARGMMRRRYGRIVSISSVVGIRGNAGQVNYAASKAGIIGMTKSLARELASRGITVNAVAPGMIRTDMTAAMPEAARQAMEQSIPCGRQGEPEDVAAAVAFLASEEAGYITGQVLCVDGGLAV